MVERNLIDPLNQADNAPYADTRVVLPRLFFKG